MKLQDALKKIIREFGMSVLREKRLVFLLSDYKAFDDYPAVKQIMKSIAYDGYGKELCRLWMDGSSAECLNYAGRLKRTLSCNKHFKPELTDYAVNCILFSMGFVPSVREPSDHGFDPFGNGSASHEQGIRQKDSVSGSHKNENHTGTESAEDWYRLGMSYADGSGVHQNYSMAVEYWRKAAELGHSGAQRCLGFAYAKGQGVVQDNAEALIWYRKAAAQGDDQAKKCLQDLYSAAAGQNSSGRSPAGSHGYSGGGNSGQNRMQGLGDSHPEQNGAGGSSVNPDPKYYSDKQYSLLSPVGWLTGKGRISVAQFWGRLIIWSLLLWSFLRIFIGPRIKEEDTAFIIIFVCVFVVFFWGYLSILVRRCHDLDWDDDGIWVCAGWVLVALIWGIVFISDPNGVLNNFHNKSGIPITSIPNWLVQSFGAGLILFSGYFLRKIGFVKGTDGGNRFGPDPTK